MEKKNFVILLVSTALAAFLGSFLAPFFIFTIHKPMMPPPPHPFFERGPMHPPTPQDIDRTIKQNEKMMEEQEEFFDKMEDNFVDKMGTPPGQAHFIHINNTGLKTQETKDMYKIIVDLKPFDNNQKNVDVKIKGNSITISAKYESKNKNDFSSSQFYQSMTLPSKINPNGIKQQKEGNSLIVLIPKTK